MSNNVSIIVEADLGDTLVKLDLAKHAVNDLGDESENTAAKQDAAAASTGFFQDALTALNGALNASIPLFGGFTAPLVALPVVAGVAAAAVVVLADAIGSVIAVAADLVAPLTLVTGLLGGLGLGFALAAKQAFGDGGSLHGALGKLKDQFHTLTGTLANDFMPQLRFLATNAEHALGFLNRIAKLPLDDAFKKLATQGVPAVEKFLGQVGHMLAHPIRLAFQIAFGTGKGGNEVASAVSHLWNQLSDFLFGYTKTHFLRLDGRVFKISQQHVDGIFQPLIDWFDRHNFTKKGRQLGHEMLNGFLGSGASQKMGNFFVRAWEDAFRTVGHAAVNWAENLVNTVFFKAAWAHHLNSEVEHPFFAAFDSIRNHAASAISSIVNHFGSIRDAINTITGIANRFLDVLHQIAGFFSQVFTFQVNWPSPPSWLGAVLGGIGGGSSSSTAGRTGMGGNSANVAGVGGNVIHVTNHFHGVDMQNLKGAKLDRVAHVIGDAIIRRQNVQSGSRS